MEKRIKTYGVMGLMEWNAQIQSGNVKVHVNFTGGYENKWGVAPAVYSTDNPITQRLIENSFEFKSGRIQLIGNYEVESKEKKADKKEEEAVDGIDWGSMNNAVTEEKPAQKTANEKADMVVVSSLDDAKQYLNEKYGVQVSKLRSKESIETAAKQHGVKFVGL